MMDGSKKNNHDMKHVIMPMAHNSYPVHHHTVKSHDPMMSYQMMQAAQPGAWQCFQQAV